MPLLETGLLDSTTVDGKAKIKDSSNYKLDNTPN